MQIYKKITIFEMWRQSALLRLAQEGFVKIIKNRGAFVANPTQEEMLQAYNVRKLLEKKAVTEAAHFITDADIKRLHALIEEEKIALEENDAIRYLNLNKEFHMHIAERSGNHFLVEFIERLINETNIYVILFDSFFIDKSYSPRVTEDHLSIIRFLEEKNIPSLLETMDTHMEKAYQITSRQQNPYRSLDTIFKED